jgi:hypothetical protein
MTISEALSRAEVLSEEMVERGDSGRVEVVIHVVPGEGLRVDLRAVAEEVYWLTWDGVPLPGNPSR